MVSHHKGGAVLHTIDSFLLICIALVLAAGVSAQELPNPFKDYGVGAPVAEARGVVTTQTADGRSLVIGVALDQSARGYLVLTDIDSGESTQVYCPDDVPNSAAYGSLMAANGRFYTAQGGIILEFDPQTAQWLWHGRPSPAGCYLSFIEHTDGTIWAGGLGCYLVSYNPRTQEAKDYGRMDEAEQYLNSLAFDDAGWVYGGIGTARQNIVACNTATGEMVQLAAEEDRVLGTASVYATVDGKAVGIINDKKFVLYEGKATPPGPQALGAPRPTGKVYYGQVHPTFPDGRKLAAYSMADKGLRVQDPRTGQSKEISFEYDSGGASITSIGPGPDGIVYGSTCHPMHFLRFDTNTRELSDYGAVPGIGGGNMCSIATQGQYVMGAVYSSGTMWLFDTTLPFNAGGKREDLALKARDLVDGGEFTGGHFTYLDSYDVAFFCGDDFGGAGSFRLMAPEAGEYYLHVLPLVSKNYCRAQFSLDGKPLGEPVDGFSENTEPGPVQVFGPLQLAAGEHTFTATLLETEGQKPWFSICSMQLSRQPLTERAADTPPNPRTVAAWHEDLCRPRAALAHPDGEHFVMAGYAGYGRVGGGIGIYNTETGESQLLTADEDLLPGHSAITLKALPNGDLIGGTDVGAPGGGHATATEGELLILDWVTKEIVFHAVPVAGQKSIISIEVGPDGLVYGLTGGSVFFVFDPATKQVVRTEQFAEYGSVPRHALHLGPDGGIYAMMSKAILRIAPGTFEHEVLATPPAPISAGGALVNGLLCYACNANLWTYEVPGL